MNLVLHNLLSAKKNPPKELSDPTNPENVEEEQGVPLSIKKKMRNTSRDPIEYWYVRRQEKNSKCRPLENKERGMNLRAQFVPGDWCGR